MRHESATVGIVGLGGLGAASAYFAARSGARVVGFDQFEFGHVRGASHDHSRIIRRSYHTPHYVKLAAGAYAAWREVEAAAGISLITITGGVDLFPPGAAIPPAAYLDSLAAVGVEHEWIGGDEIRWRWPAFQVADDVSAIVSPDTGIVPAALATRTLLDLARAAGADLRDRIPVRALEPVPAGGVDIVTGTGRHRVDRVIVTADAWADRLLATLGVELPLAVTHEQVTYVHHQNIARLGIGDLPVWIWMDDPSFYGFPEFGGTRTIKVAEDCGGPLIDPDVRGFDPDETAEQRVVAFTEGLLGGPLVVDHSVRCLYTLTSDRDFVLDRVPGADDVVVGLGAAHGFKFAAWFGRTLAGLALDQPGDDDLGPFSMSRPSLYEPIDRSSWLV